ncbi:hypothetical protein [Thiothrix caldifontis]|nr:hypothetical protein [Thiothrix caldifontis]
MRGDVCVNYLSSHPPAASMTPTAATSTTSTATSTTIVDSKQ